MTIDIANTIAKISPEWGDLPKEQDIQIMCAIAYSKQRKEFGITLQVLSRDLHLTSCVMIRSKTVKKLLRTQPADYRIMRVSSQDEEFKKLSKQQEKTLKQLNSSCLQAMKKDLIKSERHSPVTMAVKSELYSGTK